MERKDEELIASLLEREPELRRYYEEHVDLEAAARRPSSSKHYLTPEEEVEKKRLQKLKLAGQGQDHGDPRPAIAATERESRCVTPSRSWSRTSSACSRASPACSAAAASTSRACRSPRRIDPTVSRITLVTRGDDQVLEQIEQAARTSSIAVIKVIDFTDTAHVERELVLIKVTADERTRGELVNIVDIFRGKVIDVVAAARTSSRSPGTEDKIDALIELLKPIGIKEIVRTGKVAMFRGTRRPHGRRQGQGAASA